MAGLSPNTPIPIEVALRTASRTLALTYEDGSTYELSHEFLRVFSPSAEVRGHGVGQEVLQVGKKELAILSIESVGNYAIRPIFSDGHDSGLFSWDILSFFCQNQAELWAAYLQKLEAAGESREPKTHIQEAQTPAPKCGFVPKATL